MSARSYKRAVYLTLRVTGVAQQNEELRKLMVAASTALRMLMAVKLAAAVVAAPTPIGIALTSLTAVSLTMDLGGAM